MTDKPEMMKWYDSDLADNIGRAVLYGALIISLSYGLKSCATAVNNYDTVHGRIANERKRTEAETPPICTEDLNSNRLLEQYLVVGDQRFFSQIDGRSVEELVK